jgi:hypothetical protein
MADNAGDGAHVYVRILPALACNVPWARLVGKRPPKYDATVGDQPVPNTVEPEVNDAGII